MHDERSHVIDVRDVCFRYTRHGKLVLNHISLMVDAGEILCLLGPSGGGKTTLVDNIMGIQVPATGSVAVLGEQAPYRHVRSRVGFMPQDTALYEDITAQDNLRFFGELYGLHGKELTFRMHELFALVHLLDDRKKLVKDFSGGMKRRLSLAVALVQRPDVLLLDEPTVGLDPEQRMFIWNHLNALADHGVTILVTTHVMDEAQRCSRIAMIRRGTVMADGATADICRSAGVANLEDAFLALGEARNGDDRDA